MGMFWDLLNDKQLFSIIFSTNSCCSCFRTPHTLLSPLSSHFTEFKFHLFRDKILWATNTNTTNLTYILSLLMVYTISLSFSASSCSPHYECYVTNQFKDRRINSTYSLEILGFGIHVDVVVAAKYTNHKQCVWNIKPLYGNSDHSQQDSVLHHYPETA